MADFRQRTIDNIPTQAPVGNYSVPTTSAAGTLFSGLATGLGAFITGKQRDQKDYYDAMQEYRAQAAFEQSTFLFNQGQEERHARNQYALNQSADQVNVLRQQMKAQGIDPDGFAVPLLARTPEQLTSLGMALDNSGRIGNLLDNRDSTRLKYRMLLLHNQFVQDNPDMADEAMKIFKQNNGQTFGEYVTGVADERQTVAVGRAKEYEQLLAAARKTSGHPEYTDEQALEFARKMAKLEVDTKYLAYSNAALSNRKNQIELANATDEYRIRRSATTLFPLLANGANAAVRDAIEAEIGARSAAGGGLGVPDTRTPSQKLADFRNAMSQQVLGAFRAHGLNPDLKDLTGYSQTIEDYVKIYDDFITNKTSAEQAKNRLEAAQALNDFALETTPGVGQGLALTRALKNFSGDLVGVSGQADIRAALAPVVHGVANAISGNPHPAISSAISPTPHPLSISGRDTGATETALPFYRWGLGEGLSPLGAAAPSVPIDLGGDGRSLTNIPLGLRPQARVGPGIKERLDALRPSMAAVHYNLEKLPPNKLGELVSLTADPSFAATLWIDPKYADTAKQAIAHYHSQMMMALAHDFKNAGSSIADRGEAQSNPLGMGWSLGLELSRGSSSDNYLGHGVQLHQREDGSVYFAVDPNVPAARRANAEQTTRLFNNKYAPRMTELVRSYAHMWQPGDEHNYTRSLGSIMDSGLFLNTSDNAPSSARDEATFARLRQDRRFDSFSNEDIRKWIKEAKGTR